MEKNKLKTRTFRNVVFCDSKNSLKRIDDNSAEIRLGISLADEKAKQELRRRRVCAPLNIEQRLLLKK